jgi:hypothetical protein
MTEYKKLQDFDYDFLKSYPKEHYEEMLKQMDPDDPMTKIMGAGVNIVFGINDRKNYDRAMSIIGDSNEIR